LIGLLKAYRVVISPLYGDVCKFHPTCSAYALDAVTQHGAIKGSWLSVKRLVRCHPWSLGGYDPVPEANSAEVHRV
ncbi:MAG: membrane protein insertion efficiency factor YidD, partial [Propioniciclava sp.]